MKAALLRESGPPAAGDSPRNPRRDAIPRIARAVLSGYIPFPRRYPAAELRHMRRHCTGKIAAAIGGALLMVGAWPAAAARATAFGPPAPYFADNNNHTFFYNGVTVQNITATEWSRTNRLNPTDMSSDVFQSSNNDTDVIVEDATYTTGAMANYWGGWTCVRLVSGSADKCNSGKLQLNLRFGYANYALTCQEIGHSLGLGHASTAASCMYQNANQATNYYSSHEITDHINDRY